MKFWDSINIADNSNDCWEWKSKIRTGDYGNTSHKGRYWASHRLAWYLTYGEIPNGLCVCHKCDNPPCCNPKHLFLGTNQENIDDRERKGRNKMPHSLGEKHGQHRLTEKDVKEIRELYSKTNHTYRSLSSIYKVTFGEVRNVIKGRCWGWLE